MGGTDWIDLAQDRDGWRALVIAVMNLQVPQNLGNFLTSCESVTFSRRTLLHRVSKKVNMLQHMPNRISVGPFHPLAACCIHSKCGLISKCLSLQ